MGRSRGRIQQNNVNVCRPKFMLGSLYGVMCTIPKLGCKSSGLSSGQNPVFLVGTCRLLRTGVANWLLQTGAAKLFGLFGRLPGHLHPARSFAHQRFLWCIGGSNSTVREFVCRHGSCLLTKGGSKQHSHVQKGQKSQTCRQYSMQNRGLQIAFSRAFGIYPTYPPPLLGHSAGVNEATTAPTPENAPCWHKTQRS